MAQKTEERRNEIAARITREGEITVDALAALYTLSPETIRRDLSRLSEQGRIRKVHGGARPAQLHTEPSFLDRMVEDADEKQRIGEKLGQELLPGDTVFIDTGSTTLIACEALAEIKNLTVITNSLLIAQRLGATKGQRVFLLGGVYGGGNQQTLGPMVIEQIDRFRVDYAVLTLAGIDPRAGVTYAESDEAEIARAMIERAESVIFLAHSSKYRRRAGFRVCSLDQINTLLTVTPPPEALSMALKEAEVRVA